MACGDNKGQTVQQQSSYSPVATTNGSPPMSMGNSSQPPINNTALSSLFPYTMPQTQINPQQMAQQAASMPTASSNTTTKSKIITDGIMPDGSYNPKFDTTFQQQAGRMKALQDSGAFETPYQKAMKQHPFLMGAANAMQAFGQGLTKQPYYTGNQENQAALQGKSMDNLANMNSPANAMTMLMMQQMQKSMNPQNTTTLPSVIDTPTLDDGFISFAKSHGYSDQEAQQYLAGRK